MTPDDRTDIPTLEPFGRRSMPGTVFAAGILWIIYGVLQIGGQLLGAALAAQADKPPVSPNMGCGLLFGIAFGYVGYQTVTGTAKDTLGNGIGSLVLGLLAGGAAVLVLNSPQLAAEDQTVALAIIGLSVTILVTAGILALAGRPGYRAWRAARRG